jgi:hypothetical protein
MILTNAVSGIARSGATRSGYPVLQGAKVPLYALSNLTRSGATRSNYVGSRTFINIGGIDYGSGVVGAGVGILAESLTKSDAINNTPVTLAFTARGWVPVEGSDVVVTFGSKNNDRREFGGTILTTRHRYVGDRPVAANMLYDVACIDYTWALDRRKVSGNYTSASVAAIAASLLTYAPAGYTLRVDPDIGAEILDQITFTEQALSSAFTQLAKRVGGDFLCDFAKVVHLFYENTALAPPRIVNAVHPSLANIAFTRDLSQVATRVLGNFGGSNALEQLAPGATLLPVATAAWYRPQGGTVLVGQQRVQYTGLQVGGGGSLVGPGAAPTGTPNASLQPGAGVDVGSHDYAVTYQTATGESVPGPRLTVPVGVFLPPVSAPTPGAPGGGGTGPDPGVHDYAVSFVISTGETVPGPRVSVSTDLVPPPTTGPTAASGAVGPGPDPGTHDYAVTFITPTGETPAGPIGSAFTQSTSPIAQPATAPTVNPPTANGSVTPGSHYYAVSYVTASGETTIAGAPIGSTGTSPGTAVPNPGSSPYVIPSPADRRLTANFSPNTYVNYSYVYRTPSGTTTAGPSVQIQTVWCGVVGNNSIVQPTIQPYNSTDGRVTSIDIYRLYIDTGNNYLWYKVATLANDTGGSLCAPVWDDFSQAAGSAPPPTNTTAVVTPLRTIPLRNIPIGPNGVTARKLYRTAANASGPYYLLTTIPNNSTTSFDDTLADAATVQPPTTNTAYVNTAAHLTAIPTGSTAVTGRKIYRRSGGVGLRYVATIANNSTTTYDDTLANAALAAAPPTGNTAVLRQIPLSAIPLGNSLVTARKVYRTPANTGGGTLQLVATLADNTTTTLTDTVTDAALGAAALTVGTAQAAQVQLSAIPVGAAAVTARKLYRTKAGTTPLLLRATLADNTTTTYLDTLADASLGATAPVSDTSGLQQPQGNVFAGSPTLPCASVAAFLPSGGWAIVGSQNIRYTGISGNALLGIPATGPGAITATITYNTTAVAAAMLTGIPTTGLGVIKYTVLKGDPVNVFVQVDDLAAQAAVRAQLPGSDGIIEDELQDGRLGYLEGVDRCQARLDLLGALDSTGQVGVIAVTYVCRDTNTIAGATATINLGPPINLRGDFLIQRVGVNQFHVPNLNPTYTVEASSIRFSAEEMLRLLRQGAL